MNNLLPIPINPLQGKYFDIYNCINEQDARTAEVVRLKLN